MNGESADSRGSESPGIKPSLFRIQTLGWRQVVILFCGVEREPGLGEVKRSVVSRSAARRASVSLNIGNIYTGRYCVHSDREGDTTE